MNLMTAESVEDEGEWNGGRSEAVGLIRIASAFTSELTGAPSPMPPP
jgi:hypothetical protein